MVFFTCNNCGDSLQKPKVVKHYQFACRTTPFLTCVDCHKDFRGDEYVAHTKCISESERYGGKDYVQKPSANKGEKKQQAWIDVVQNTLTNSKTLTVPERNLLNSISKHDNIPRKKAKFLNFIRNLSNNRVNMSIVESVWDKMEKAFKDASGDNGNSSDKNNKNKNVNKEDNQNNSNICKENSNANDTIDNANAENETKENEEKENKKKKKSKKRQLEAEDNENEQPAIKKHAEETNGNQEENNESATNGVDVFSWKNTILEIVTAKGEISVKKLRKKVLAQYLANFPEENSEKATTKFEKKLKKVSGVSIVDEKVKLSKA